MKFSSPRVIWLCVGYVVLHFVAHISAALFVVDTIAISIWYPPSGLALSLLVLLGPRYAGLVFLTNVASAWTTESSRELWTAIFYPALITADYAAAAWLVRRYLGPRLLPGGRRGSLVFCLTMLLAPLPAALVGTTVMITTTPAHKAATPFGFLRAVFDWAIGDASGLLTVIPVAMVFVLPWLEGKPSPLDVRLWRWNRIAGAVGRATILLGMLLLVLAVPLLREYSAFYLCFLPLVWICVHHGLPGATLATLLIMMVGLVGMRFTNTSPDFSYIFLLFEVAVAGVGLGLGTLVTRRNEAEAKLAASQAQLDRVIAGAQLGLWDWNIPEKRFESNAFMAGMLGYAPGEIASLVEGETALLHPADRPKVKQMLSDHLEGQTSLYETEYRLMARDGSWRWIHARGSVVARDNQQRPLHVSGTHVDITERRQAQAEIGRLHKIIEATPDFVLTADARGRVLYANAALLSIWSQAESDDPPSDRRLDGIFSGDSGRRVREEIMPAAQANGMWQGELVITGGESGYVVPVSQVVLAHREEAGDVFTFSFIMRDISDQKRAEAESIERERHLLQLQKNESLGVLAGGIAHDFNNLLTAIVGNSNLARFELPPQSPVQELLASVEQAAARASALCHQMLAYAGRTSVAFAELDLNRLIDDAFQLIAPGLSKKILVTFERAAALPPMLAASVQMQQVIMNLTLNAADAIGDQEGRLTLRTLSRRLGTVELQKMFPNQKLAPGMYAVLEVEDTGCGMTPEVKARIFEPFFTTKFTGQGLGLSAVIGVVRAHHGAISVESTPGKGAKFRLAFPALEARSAPPVVAPVAAEKWSGAGKILVVDDDSLIREVTQLLLTKLGFTPVVASDGLKGVEAFRQHASELRAVLLDLTMPGMDGFEAHAEMHRHDPSVPVILMSGFSQKLAQLPPAAIHPAGVMAKPFGVAQLRERLQAVLK